MTGRHAGKAADNLAVNLAVLAGVPLGLLGLLAVLGWLIYLAATTRFTNQDFVIAYVIITFIWGAKFIGKWREERRFPPVEALCVLVPASTAAVTLAPSWHWVHWVGYVVASLLLVMLIGIEVRRWRQRRTARELTL